MIYCVATVVCALVGACAAPMTMSGDAPATAEDWLQRIEERTADLDTLQAKITLITVQGLLGDEQRRFGTLLYDAADEDAGEPTRFRLDLDRAVVDNALEERKQSFIFDGRWLAERNENSRTFIRRQLADADNPASGEPQLDMGDGPFVLPLNLKKDKILQRFEATAIPPAKADPPNTAHLLLVPRPGVEVEQEHIDIWFDRNSLLPVRVDTVTSDQTEQTILLREVRINPELDEDAFDTTPPEEPGWKVSVKPRREDAEE